MITLLKVVIIPQSVFGRGASGNPPPGNWTLRNPPGYEGSKERQLSANEMSAYNQSTLPYANQSTSPYAKQLNQATKNLPTELDFYGQSSEQFSHYNPSYKNNYARIPNSTAKVACNNDQRARSKLDQFVSKVKPRVPESFSNWLATDHANAQYKMQQGSADTSNKKFLGLPDSFSRKGSKVPESFKEFKCPLSVKGSREVLQNQLSFYQYVGTGEEATGIMG